MMTLAHDDRLAAYLEGSGMRPSDIRLPNGGARPTPVHGYSAAELEGMNFPPIRYVIDGYIAEGLTILAGRPKLGKSWLCLDVACAVADGGVAFGSIPVVQGDVLYLALEDNQRRMQRRMRSILPAGRWPQRLTIWHECGSLDTSLAQIRAWIDDAENPRLVIVDVFARVRPEKKASETQYDADYRALTGLHTLASESSVAIVAVTHTRKMDADDPLDTVSGTLGLAGAADSVLVLARAAAGVTIYGRGRDIEEIETAVKFEPDLCRWTILGNANEVHRSDERGAIIDALAASEPLSPTDLANVTGQPNGNIRKLLHSMVGDGQIEREGRGRYRLPGNIGHKVTSAGNNSGNSYLVDNEMLAPGNGPATNAYARAKWGEG